MTLPRRLTSAPVWRATSASTLDWGPESAMSTDVLSTSRLAEDWLSRAARVMGNTSRGASALTTNDSPGARQPLLERDVVDVGHEFSWRGCPVVDAHLPCRRVVPDALVLDLHVAEGDHDLVPLAVGRLGLVLGDTSNLLAAFVALGAAQADANPVGRRRDLGGRWYDFQLELQVLSTADVRCPRGVPRGPVPTEADVPFALGLELETDAAVRSDLRGRFESGGAGLSVTRSPLLGGRVHVVAVPDGDRFRKVAGIGRGSCTSRCRWGGGGRVRSVRSVRVDTVGRGGQAAERERRPEARNQENRAIVLCVHARGIRHERPGINLPFLGPGASAPITRGTSMRRFSR